MQMPTDLNRAGKRLREFREKKGLSLREFGERIGVSHSYLSNIENGKKPVTIKVLTKAAKVFDVDVAVFLIDEQTEPLTEKEEWYLLGQTLEKEGITIDTVKEWVEIAKTFKKERT
jgi:transcriptional regulator with XRE-family HTH domain